MPLIFLDRDGILNRSFRLNGRPFSPRDVGQVQIMEGVPESIELLKKYDFTIIVVTNQPDVARGLITEDSVRQINRFLANELGIDLFYVCIHDDEDECECRKPKDGLLRKAAIDLNQSLESSFMVGDRWSDIQAGQSAGCICYFVDYSYDEKRPDQPFYPVDSLLGAVKDIVRYYDKTRA